MEVVVSSFYARYGGADCAVVGSALPMQTQKAVAAACGGPIARFIHYLLRLCGDEVNTKSRGCGCRLRLGVDGGADSRKTSFPPCRLHHPHRHARYDDSRRDGKKSGPWP